MSSRTSTEALVTRRMKRQTQWPINQRNHVAESQIFWLTLCHRCAQMVCIWATISHSTTSISEVLRKLALMLRNCVSLCLTACTSVALSLATVLSLTLSTGPKVLPGYQQMLYRQLCYACSCTIQKTEFLEPEMNLWQATVKAACFKTVNKRRLILQICNSAK